MRKEIKPGDSFSIRIPIDTDPEIIKYLNKDRTIKLNKLVTDLLFSKIKEVNNTNNKQIVLDVPTSLTIEQEEKLKQSIVGLLNIMNLSEQKDATEEDEIDYSIYNGLDI